MHLVRSDSAAPLAEPREITSLLEVGDDPLDGPLGDSYSDVPPRGGATSGSLAMQRNTWAWLLRNVQPGPVCHF